MRLIARESQALGDIVRMSQESAVLATYFRNNVLHLFALPSLVACAFTSNERVSSEDMQRLAWRIYPYVAEELFLRWSEAELPGVIDGVLACLAGHGLIEADAMRGSCGGGRRRAPPRRMQLSLLAQATIQTIERYYLAVAQLVKAGSGEISQAALEERCQLTAQRIGAALRPELAGILRPLDVRELHWPVARARRSARQRGRQAGIRRGAAACGAGRTVRAERAAAPQYPAGNTRLMALPDREPES